MHSPKYRAWDSSRKEMNYKVMVGNTIDVGTDNYTAHMIMIDGEWVHFDEHDDRIILMQFTGLKSKSGEDIFEGDIVASSLDVPTEIYWGNKVRWVGMSDGNPERFIGFFFDYYNCNFTQCEVIGNIYQNPELRKD